MASRVVQLCFSNARPTYNNAIILTCQFAFMENANVSIQEVDVTVGQLDTIIQIQSALAAAARSKALALGLSTVGVNDVSLLGLAKA